MSRPCKQRYVAALPTVNGFHPDAAPQNAQHILVLLTDELEALRLADIKGLSQEEGAARMNVSRATFGRILERAHRTVADALVNGKILRFGGGEVVPTRHRHLQCRRCRRQWDVPRTVASAFRCPRCHA